MKTIKEVFENVTRGMAIDKALIDRIHHFERNFVNRNDEHIGFFGGNLLGVDKPKFKPSDWNTWFDDVVRIDDVDLRVKLHALPSVNPNFNVASDVLNHTCMWLVHAIFNSKLSAADKHRAMVDTLLVFQYKVITSKMDHDFPFYANREVAMATYAALSKKFSLKQHGSWGAVLRQRAENIIAPNSIHYNTIKTYEPDKKVLYLITDSQGRVKELIKSQWNVINQVKANDVRVVNQSNMISFEGEDIVRDTVNGLIKYRDYIHSVVGNPKDFIKPQIVDFIAETMHTMSPTLLEQALNKLSEMYWKDTDDFVHNLINETMIHAFDVMQRDALKSTKRIDLPALVLRLSGVYMAARSTDPTLLRLREHATLFVTKALPGKNASTVAAVRTGMLMYIVTRAFTMHHFSA